MEYEVFDHEWQRVAVDKAPTTYNQLQDLFEVVATGEQWWKFVDRLDEKRKGRSIDQIFTDIQRELTIIEQATLYGQQIMQRRLWAIRNNDWQFRNENGEWENA